MKIGSADVGRLLRAMAQSRTRAEMFRDWVGGKPVPMHAIPPYSSIDQHSVALQSVEADDDRFAGNRLRARLLARLERPLWRAA